MNQDEVEEVVQGLKKWGGFVEVEEMDPRTTGRPRPAAAFRCLRKSHSGKERQVVVELFDSGRRRGRLRYYFEALPDGQTKSRSRQLATGNPEPSIIEALVTTHWDKLDD